jgi:patatin-like phospholipase/acyl hydrolase
MSTDTEKPEAARNKITRSFNILSLDGGGIRGTLEAVFVDRLAKECPRFLQKTDLVVGVSTGGLQALSLAAGKSPAEIREMYEVGLEHVFADSLLDDFRDLWKLAGADYSNKNLRKVLESRFGDMKLRDLGKRVAVVTFDLDNGVTAKTGFRTWKPKIFHNFPGEDTDGEARVVDVALRTTAAPTYFPTYQGYCDGGVAANNPVMVGVAQALDPRGSKTQLDHLKVLSLGTGRTELYVKGNNHDWGIGQWGAKLLHLVMEGPREMASFQCAMILKDRFHRVNPTLKGAYALDNWKKIPELVAVAEAYDLNPTLEWLEEHWI